MGKKEIKLAVIVNKEVNSGNLIQWIALDTNNTPLENGQGNITIIPTLNTNPVVAIDGSGGNYLSNEIFYRVIKIYSLQKVRGEIPSFIV